MKFMRIQSLVILRQYDHLDGCCFLTLNPLRRRLIKGKLSDISEASSKLITGQFCLPAEYHGY
jgi:hypothetical protein